MLSTVSDREVLITVFEVRIGTFVLPIDLYRSI